MRFVRRCLALILLAAAPLAAGDFSWTHVPFVDSDSLPGNLYLTGDPAVSYTLVSTGMHRSEDGGRNWRKVETPVGMTELAVDPHDSDSISPTPTASCFTAMTAAAATAAPNPLGGFAGFGDIDAF